MFWTLIYYDDEYIFMWSAFVFPRAFQLIPQSAATLGDEYARVNGGCCYKVVGDIVGAVVFNVEFNIHTHTHTLMRYLIRLSTFDGVPQCDVCFPLSAFAYEWRIRVISLSRSA